MATHSLLTLSSTVALLFVQSTVAIYSFNTSYDSQNNGQLINPADLLQNMKATPACLKAYVANFDCDPQLFDFSFERSNANFDKAKFDKACTKTCEVAFAQWIENTWKVCTNQPETVTTFNGINTPDYTMLRYYRAFCTQDLNNGTYCLTEQNPVHLDVGVNYTTAEKEQACKDTCFTQNSAMMWSSYNNQNSTSVPSLQNIKDVCPNVDTSNYEVLRPVADVALASSAETTSSTSTLSTPSTSSMSASASAAGLATPSINTASSPSTTSAKGTASPTAANHAVSISRISLPISFLIIAFAFTM